MLNSVLLHLSSHQQEAVIDVAVSLASRTRARVRGLTLIDTRRLAALSATCEAAVFTKGEFDRLGRLEAEHDALRMQLSQACLCAGLDFDLRRSRGNPLEVLPLQAQFHDLVVTAFPPPQAPKPAPTDLTAAEWIELLLQGVQPLLVVRRADEPLTRVLLVSDGTPAGSRAIRQFLHQDLLPRAELRLLGIGETPSQAQDSLSDMAEYCRTKRQRFESGFLCGTPRHVLLPYAEKWGAHLVVMGVSRGNRVVRRLLGEVAEKILLTTSIALYAAA